MVLNPGLRSKKAHELLYCLEPLLSQQPYTGRRIMWNVIHRTSTDFDLILQERFRNTTYQALWQYRFDLDLTEETDLWDALTITVHTGREAIFAQYTHLDSDQHYEKLEARVGTSRLRPISHAQDLTPASVRNSVRIPSIRHAFDHWMSDDAVDERINGWVSHLSAYARRGQTAYLLALERR